MLLIYSSPITSRLRFVFDFIFKEQLGMDYRITDDRDEFLKSDSPKFSYAFAPLSGELNFRSHSLIFENDIHEQDYSVLKTDQFATVFFLLSRYEEYLPHHADAHGRFDDNENILSKNNEHQSPVVDHLILDLKKILNSKFPELKFADKKFQFTPTYDIDAALHYTGKGLIRNAGGFLMSILQLDFASFNERLRVLAGNKIDPFDTFDWLNELHDQHNLKPVYFFLLGDFSKHDRNVNFKNQQFRNLIKRISEKYEVGVHPSYQSNFQEERLHSEIKRLEDITGKKVKKSRQHFLKMELPTTYHHLIESGITDDYTMGFSSQIGFRAGTTQSFFFYDLKKEESTTLRIHPFALMDATIFYYLKQTPSQALDNCRKIINEVKKVNGNLTTLWHNNFVSEWNEFRGWSGVYKSLIEETQR